VEPAARGFLFFSGKVIGLSAQAGRFGLPELRAGVLS
jgi:hypothetical protein